MTALPVFFAAMFLLNITPGPDMLYVLARATGQGRAAGLVSALGVGAGGFFHIFAVAFGLAGLLRTVPAAYTALRLAGAAYLIYLGVRTLLARGPGDKSVTVAPASLKRIFVQGVLTNVLNPEGGAFLPGVSASVHKQKRQCVRADRGAWADLRLLGDHRKRDCGAGGQFRWRCAAKPDWRGSGFPVADRWGIYRSGSSAGSP